jgi:stage II sporulation protein D
VIRVLIGEESGTFTIESKGGFRVEGESGVVLLRNNDPSRVSIRRQGTSTELHFEPQGTAAVAEGDVFITPFKSANLVYRGVAYPGRVRLHAPGSGTMCRVINVLPLETYLEGVVPHEMGDPGPDAFAALEAQAITARTYAMSKLATRKADAFDAFADVRDQVYRGRERTYQLATGAVRETRGIVLEYKGDLARTYYSATCGGHTSDIRKVWPQRESARYLEGIYDRGTEGGESFCASHYKYRWRFTFTGKELGEILRKTIPAELGVAPNRVGHLMDIGVSERSLSGRVKYLEIITSKESFTVEGDRIRWVLMTDPDEGTILPSTLFAIQKGMSNRRVSWVSFVGGGNGHGVGMCQNGAIQMARKGYSRDMILAHYYPGTKLKKEY